MLAGGCVSEMRHGFKDCLKRTRSLDGVLGEGLNNGRLVLLGVYELVEEDLDARVGAGKLGDLVGNGGRIGEGRDVLSDTSEAEGHVLGVGSAELGLALLTEDGEVEGLRVGAVLSANVTRKTRVDTTTETLVGRADNQKGLALSLDGLGLSLVKDLLGSLSVGTGRGHGTLGAGELGRGDNLHGLGDLLNVANRLETTLDFTESGEVGGIGSLGPTKAQRISTMTMGCARSRTGGFEGKAVSTVVGKVEGRT